MNAKHDTMFRCDKGPTGDARRSTSWPEGILVRLDRLSLGIGAILWAAAFTVLGCAGRTAAVPPSMGASGMPSANAEREATAMIGATAETEPVPSRGDAADDPAIWVHPTDPARSIVIGTDKKGGLIVYDLAGRQIQSLRDGRMVNVDVRDGFSLAGRPIALVTAGNRAEDSVAAYAVNPSTGLLEDVVDRTIKVGIPVYGSCMYHSSLTDQHYVFVNSKRGEVEQWVLHDDGTGHVRGSLVRRFVVGSQTEGCVADDALGHLYIGEEAVGVWKYAAEPDGGTVRRMVDATGSRGHLRGDVEGLTLFYGLTGSGYLIASSQGSSEFVVYRREGDNDYVARFSIGASNGIDPVTHTDGVDVVSRALPNYPRGLLVVQDNENDDGNQNFKLVSWEAVEKVLAGVEVR
jgi:3-phytase